MARQRHAPEQIIAKLRRAEIELSKGKDTAKVYRLTPSDHRATFTRLNRQP